MTTATQSIREIVNAEPSTAAVFERFQIDLCSKADATLQGVCNELKLSVDQVLEKLADAEQHAHGASVPDLESYSLARLIQHIVRIHHHTVRQELPRFVELSQRIADKHGDKLPYMKQVAALLEDLRDEMFAHLQKEENILFPYIVRLEETAADNLAVPQSCFSSIAQPIAMMMQDHDSAEGIVGKLRDLTNGFTPPTWACARNTAFHRGLAAFETDLRQHVHIENDLLFPRAILLETELAQRS